MSQQFEARVTTDGRNQSLTPALLKLKRAAARIIVGASSESHATSPNVTMSDRQRRASSAVTWLFGGVGAGGGAIATIGTKMMDFEITDRIVPDMAVASVASGGLAYLNHRYKPAVHLSNLAQRAKVSTASFIAGPSRDQAPQFQTEDVPQYDYEEVPTPLTELEAARFDLIEAAQAEGKVPAYGTFGPYVEGIKLEDYSAYEASQAQAAPSPRYPEVHPFPTPGIE
jgi:hypothetical protein